MVKLTVKNYKKVDDNAYGDNEDDNGFWQLW